MIFTLQEDVEEKVGRFFDVIFALDDRVDDAVLLLLDGDVVFELESHGAGSSVEARLV